LTTTPPPPTLSLDTTTDHTLKNSGVKPSAVPLNSCLFMSSMK